MSEQLKLYSLQEIANWTNKNSEVLIPSIQRGLVWKPRQIEFLWDSLLRGFPIGSFIFSSVEEGNKFYLMDGQQRFNAIALGFSTITSKAKVWIDLLPELGKDSTRKFLIRVTTEAHPWGYKKDDNCSLLSASERRNALEKWEKTNVNIYQNIITLDESYPYDANFPIPLSWIINTEKSIDEIKDSIQSKIKDLIHSNKYYSTLNIDEDKKNKINNYLTKIINICQNIANYKIPALILPQEGDNQDDVSTTDLEVLFARIGTGGTQITREDLNYSAIKAYWKDIQKENDEVASHYMPPAKLAMLTFRLFKSDKDLKGNLSIAEIRRLGNDKSDIHDKVVTFYQESQISKVCAQIDKWLGVDNGEYNPTPKVLRSKIACDSPDVYLLLMYFAKNKIEGKAVPTETTIRSLAFYLHWFAIDKFKCCDLIYSNCKNVDTQANIDDIIKKAVLDCIAKEYSKVIYDHDIMNDWKINETGDLEVSNPLKAFYYSIASFDKVNKEMLLYAERQYLNEHFSLYDPALQGKWEAHNTPWDYDHIIPQNWIKNKRGKFREFNQKWLNNIGNFAAITFESNRSKSDDGSWGEYDNKDNKAALLFDDGFNGIDSNITNDQKQSIIFSNWVFNRSRRIYTQCYDALLKPIFKTPIFSENIQKRKELFEKIKNEVSDSKIRYVDGKFEYEIKNEIDWARPWLSVGVVIGYFYCAVAYCPINGDTYEIGVRKSPTDEHTKDGLTVPIDKYEECTGWWYREKDCNFSDKTDIEIIKELNELIAEVKK